MASFNSAEIMILVDASQHVLMLETGHTSNRSVAETDSKAWYSEIR